MKKSILMFLLIVVAVFVAYQTGKWSGKQINPTASVPSQSPSNIAPMIATAQQPVSEPVLKQSLSQVAKIQAPSEALPEYTTSNHTYDLRQLVQQNDGKAQINFSKEFLAQNTEQLQQAMWQLEQHATNSNTYDRQQRLQQLIGNASIGNLVQLNCSDILCIAMLQYDNEESQKAAMPPTAEIAKEEQVQGTFLRINANQQHHSFFLLYGWR